MAEITLPYTPIEDIPKIHARARAAFRAGRTKDVAFRKAQIAQVGYMLKDNEEAVIAAMKHDLGRPPLESEMMDLSPVYAEVRAAYANLDQWVKPQAAEFSLNFFAMGPKLVAEPKGTVLIIAPFNFPAFLLFSPLVSAIAAGNAAVLKPSEQTPAISKIFAELLPKYLDPELYHIINGGVPETTKILELPWDHILYTGNGRVGRIVATAAARHLTPTTLELGGKNPVVIDPRVDLDLAARRILWGRFTNAGQICLSPDYVLVPADFQDKFVAALESMYKTFYPDGPEKSDSFSRVVTKAHTQRIKRLVDETTGTIVCGGQSDVETRYIAPTIVRDVREGDSLLSEEIFGPVLCIVPVKDVDEAVAFINRGDHPLAIYVFSEDPKFEQKVFSNTKSGAAVTNEVVIMPGVHGLPVGGVGASGYGYYTGKHAFEQFTHLRVSLKNPSWVDKIAFGFRFPPYTPSYRKNMRQMGGRLPPRPAGGLAKAAPKRWAFWLAFALVGAAAVLTRQRQLRLA
ncbi:aldehyde dehydrogenase [Epithele typhae]|uniref:aldehyde dehydrogenase n=1 Tax=Epithele typhae TaxID=378194 RepID=UPI002007FE2D|nr:aldehyde dehydrogenase [Epithele typhae]KAH9933554.1 aldehyde dehydrogenase [Epithele typhae]